MASGTVNSDACGGAGGGALHLDSIPVVDLRLFSQSELYSLSLCSSSAFDPRRCEEVVIPKIDRSVFNESAGSRKQTYSRLPLAPPPSSSAESRRRDPQLSLISTSVGERSDSESDTEDAENIQIVNLLKQLFVADMDLAELVTVEGHNSDAKCLSQLLPPPLVSPSNCDTAGSKRKRGRPCSSDKSRIKQEFSGDVDLDKNAGLPSMFEIIVRENIQEKDRGTLNAEGMAVNLVALGSVEHPYAAEISRRTQGLRTKVELVGFLEGLCGQWRSRRRRKKIVDASTFGSALPVGWKILLSIKNNNGQIQLCCRRYISPSGLYFVTCRGVSSYLCSLHGIQSTHAAYHAQHSEMADDADKSVSTSIVDAPIKVNSQDVMLDTKLLLSDNQEIEVEVNSLDVELHRVGETMYCSICDVAFSCEEDLLRHYAVDHKRKRCKNGVHESGEMMTRDENYECQFCHKIFDARDQYTKHMDAHLASHEKSVGDSLANGVMLAQDSASGKSLASEGISTVESKILNNHLPVDSPENAVALTDANRNMTHVDEHDHKGNERNPSVAAAFHAMRMNLLNYESQSASPGETVEHEKISLNRSPEPSDDETHDAVFSCANGNSGPLEKPEHHTVSLNRFVHSMNDVEGFGSGDQQKNEKNSVAGSQVEDPNAKTVNQKGYTTERLVSCAEGTHDVDKMNLGDASASNEHKNMLRMDESAPVMSQPEQCEERFNSESRLVETMPGNHNMYDSQYESIEVGRRDMRVAEPDDLEYAGNGQMNDHFRSYRGVLDSAPPARTDHDRKYEVCETFTSDKIFPDEHMNIFNDSLDGHKEVQSEDLLFSLNASSGISDGGSVFHSVYTNPSIHGQHHEIENRRMPDPNLSFGDIQAKPCSESNMLRQGGYREAGFSTQAPTLHRTCINQASSSVMEGSTPGDLKLGMSYGFDFNHPSSNKRREDSITNFGVSQPEGNWNGTRGEKLGTYGQNLVVGIENNNGSHMGEQMNAADGYWRSRFESNPQVCFPAIAVQQIPPSNHFHNFGITMDQGTRNAFSSRKNASPGDMMRLGNGEPVEYSFMGEHTSNLLPREPPNMLPYSNKNKEEPGPAFWLRKDALTPTNMELSASVCVWCRNMFFHEQATQPGGGMQAGSIGTVCPSCRSRFPGQVNLL